MIGKKFAFPALAASLMLSLSGCGGSSEPSPEAAQQAANTAKQEGQRAAGLAAQRGFKPSAQAVPPASPGRPMPPPGSLVAPR